MKFKRLLAISLSLVIVMTTVVACGNNAGKDTGKETAATGETGSEDSNEDGANSKEDIMTPLGKYPETIHMTTAKIAFTNANFPEGKSSTDNVTLDWIKEKLNIDVDILWEADGGDYMNKLSLAIASGDIPDMIWIPNGDYNVLRMLVENDMIEDLTEAYDKCAGDYMKSTFSSFEGKNIDPVTFDGKIYAIPGASIGYSHDVLWMRKDWLDKLGLEVPKTLEDIQNVAREFVKQDPGENGEGNTIGFAVNATTPVGGNGNFAGLEPIFNVLDAYPRQWMEDDNGKVYYGSTAPEMKEGLKIARDMYEEGLLDQSFVVRTNPGEVSALINTNQVGMYFGSWWSVFERQDLAKSHPESEWIAVNAPLDENGKFKHMEASPTANFLCVKKGFEHPEAIIKMLNLEQDMARGYIEGGVEAMKPYKDLVTNWVAQYPTGDINLEYYDIVPKTGHYISQYLEDNTFEGDELTTDQDRQIWEYTKEYVDNKDPASAGWGEYYGRYIGSTILDAPENVSMPSVFYYTTESSPEYKADLDKVEDEMYLKIITGEEDIDYFDKFVETWSQLGGDVLTEEVQEIVDSQK